MGNDIRKDIPDIKGAQYAFVIVLFVCMLVPFVGMLWAQNQETSENRDLAPVPQVIQDGVFNVDILGDAGAYFDDHFAYRPYLIDADARIYSTLFGISVADTVVDGTDGWLYYSGTLDDYQDEQPLTDAQIRCIAHNLKLFQQWCEAQGAAFVFTTAPDKNALYPQNMPSYLPGVENDSAERLARALESEGVRYVNLFELFDGIDDLQYFLRDSHWSDRGALIGHDALAKALGTQMAGISIADLQARDDYIGDLNTMLFPVSAIPETDWTAAGVNDGSGSDHALRSGRFWEFLEGSDTNDAIVVTRPTDANPYGVAEGNGSLLMFRDSFAMGLMPYFACEYEHARFDKMVPYDGLQLLDSPYDAVVVERAQRHLADLAEQPLIALSPQIEVALTRQAKGAPSKDATCEVKVEGPVISVSGTVSGDDVTQSDISIMVSDGEREVAYQPYYLQREGEEGLGYCAYLGYDSWAARSLDVRVVVDGGVVSSRRYEVE